jgi:hypothetical protein
MSFRRLSSGSAVDVGLEAEIQVIVGKKRGCHGFLSRCLFELETGGVS